MANPNYDNKIANLSYQLFQVIKELVTIKNKMTLLEQEKLHLIGRIQELDTLKQEDTKNNASPTSP